MSFQNNNKNEEEKYNQYHKKIILNSYNDINNKMKLSSIENKSNEEEEEKKEFNTMSQQTGIEILKQKLESNNNQDTTKQNKYIMKNDKENLENNLKSYIIANKSKEQKILDLLEIINQYELQISSLNKQILSLTNNNKQMKDIIKNMQFGYEQTKVNLMTEKEVNRNNNTYMNNLYQDKILSEERIKELVNIINQYSTQIDALTKTLNNLKNENINYKKENEEYKNDINHLKEQNNNLENENNNCKNDNNKLNEEMCKLKDDNKKLCEIQYNTENKMKSIMNECEKIKIEIKNEENKNISLIKAINQDFESLTKYFDTKYNNLLEEEKNNDNNNNDNEKKLSLICFQNCEKNNNDININIEQLIKTLINGFNCCKDKIKQLTKINKNFNDKIKSIDNKEDKYKELLNKEKEYIQQINKLKESNINMEKLITQFNNEILELKREINNYKNNNNNNFNNNLLLLEKKIEVLNNEIKLKDSQIENANKLIKIKDDNIYKVKEDNKKLIQDNINLIKELKKFNKKIKY